MSANITIDLTGIATTVALAILSTAAIMFKQWVQTHIKSQSDQTVISKAIDNSLGALQQAATSEIQKLHPTIPDVPQALAPGVQYVLDHAGSEMIAQGITPLAIAQKIEAKIGLANIATNLATTANATPAVVYPLAPIAEGFAK